MTEEKEALDKKLNARIEELQEDVENLKQTQEELTADLNSVYYLAGEEDELEERNIIKGSFLGLFGRSIEEADFSDFDQSMDLRESKVIELQASDLGVSRIEDVGLLPDHLREDEDYRIEIVDNGRTAKVHLLDEGAFRLACVVIHVDG
jgi:hypothetical protein